MVDTSHSMPSRPKTQPTRPSDEIDLGKLIGVLWRGKIWIGLSGFLALVAGVCYVFFIATPVYTTSTTVALESRQEQVVDIESVVSGLSGDQVAINTEVEVLKSRRLIGKVVADLGLMQDSEFNSRLRTQSWLSLEQVVEAVKKIALGQSAPIVTSSDQAVTDAVVSEVLANISVSNIRQSYVFRIAVVSEDPEKAAEIANRLAELYIEDQAVLKFERTAQATEWLSDRVAELQIELETSESQLKDFSSNTDLVSPEALIALNRQLKELRDRRADVTAAASVATARVDDLNAAQETGSILEMSAAANSPELRRLLENDGTTSQPEVFLGEFNQILARAEVEKSRFETQSSTLELSILEISESIAMQSDELVALQQFQREAEASGLIYEYFLSRLKETSVQQGLQQADSRILSYAVVPVSPSAPRKPIVLALSLIMGLFIGTMLVLMRELSQNTFRVAEDLESTTNYAVIGQVPVVPSSSRKNVLKYMQNKPNSAVAEAIRNLRTSLLLANLDNPPKVIMSCSSTPGEGKTTQSIALALNLAGLGKKVLLMEGDIRRRVMNEYFDIPEKSGFLSVMLGDVRLDDALTHLPDMGIDVLLGERSQTNAADIFSSDRFGKFLDTLRTRYDYVIIDTPPVLAVADARIIGRWVDTTIYTVKWDSTSHRQVLDGLKSFEQVNVKVTGLVLGQISARGMKRYGYGGIYGSYESYYDA